MRRFTSVVHGQSREKDASDADANERLFFRARRERKKKKSETFHRRVTKASDGFDRRGTTLVDRSRPRACERGFLRGCRRNGRSVGGRGRTWSASARSNASGSAFMMSSSSAPTRVLTSSGARRPEAAAASRARAASSSCSERPGPFEACATVVGVPRLGANRRNAPRAGLASAPRAPNPGASLRARLPRDAPASARHRATRHGPAVASACVDMLALAKCRAPVRFSREAAVLAPTRATAARRAPAAASGRRGSSRRLTRTRASSRAWWSRARVSAGRPRGRVVVRSRDGRPPTGGRESRWRFLRSMNPVTGQFPREARFAANPYPRRLDLSPSSSFFFGVFFSSSPRNPTRAWYRPAPHGGRARARFAV